ncbi:hypothetical protein BDC45DRAFT_299822 [Circinella umbellata]|nr:hypothetical protein BDC45DRAFT_299822 [Circinella umbellata]
MNDTITIILNAMLSRIEASMNFKYSVTTMYSRCCCPKGWPSLENVLALIHIQCAVGLRLIVSTPPLLPHTRVLEAGSGWICCYYCSWFSWFFSPIFSEYALYQLFQLSPLFLLTILFQFCHFPLSCLSRLSLLVPLVPLSLLVSPVRILWLFMVLVVLVIVFVPISVLMVLVEKKKVKTWRLTGNSETVSI